MQGVVTTVSKERWSIASGGKLVASRTQVNVKTFVVPCQILMADRHHFSRNGSNSPSADFLKLEFVERGLTAPPANKASKTFRNDSVACPGAGPMRVKEEDVCPGDSVQAHCAAKLGV